MYVEDGIFACEDHDVIEKAIQELKNLKLDIEVQGHPTNYIGVNICKNKDDSYELTQPSLIHDIINDVKIGVRTTSKPVPASAQKILHRCSDAKMFDKKFNYRSIIGKLNYLTQCSRPDIMYAVH